MSKAAEENGGVTSRRQQQQQQQAHELCNCGFDQRSKADRPLTVSTGRRYSLDSQRGGSLTQPNSASSRAAAAAFSPSLHGGWSSKPPPVYSSPLLQGERKLRTKGGDLQQPKSPFYLGTASPSFLEARRLRDNRRNGVEEQQAKSPAVEASPSLQWENSLRDSHRNGDGQQLKGSSGNASLCHQGERSSKSSRSSDVQKARSPSFDELPSLHDGKSLRDSYRNGDAQQAKPTSENASPSLQDGKSQRDSHRNRDAQQLKSSSENASPSLQDGKSQRDSHRNRDTQQSKSSSENASPYLQDGKSQRDSHRNGDAQQSSGNASLQDGKILRDSQRNGDVQQLKSSSGNASATFQDGKSLTSSSRSLDVQKGKSASVDGSSASLQVGKNLRISTRSVEEQQPNLRISTRSVDEQQPNLRISTKSVEEQQSKSSAVNAFPSTPLTHSRRSGYGQLLNSSSTASPSSQAERSLKDNGRVGGEQQQARSHSLDVSPSLHRTRGLSDSLRNEDVPVLKYPSVGLSDSLRKGDVPVLKYPSVCLSDSLRNGDVPLLKYPSGASSSRAIPSPTSASIFGSGFEEIENSGDNHANSAPLVSPSRIAPNAPSSTPPSLKSKLESGQKLYGAFLVSFSTVVAEILGWAGYDFVVVDLEQLFPGDTLAALPVLQALASTGTPAIFRVPADDPVLVNKALDMGPAGMMFSMIENEEAARNAVASCRYPPRGTRRGSRHVVSRASRYGLDASYMNRCEEELLVICQVEITEALDHIMDIAGVEGVDCIQMGGLDFGASLGDPYFDYNKEKVLARQRKVLLAGFATPENSPDVLFKRGYHLVSGALDVVLLRNAALADLRRNKPSLKA